MRASDKTREEFEAWIADQRSNFCSMRQWDSVDNLLENKGSLLKGYIAGRKRGEAEIEKVHEMYRAIELKRGKSIAPQLAQYALAITHLHQQLEDCKVRYMAKYDECNDLKELIKQAVPFVEGFRNEIRHYDNLPVQEAVAHWLEATKDISQGVVK